MNQVDRTTRLNAVKALGKYGDLRAVEHLLPLAHDVRWEVQGAVAEALGLIGDPRALETLYEMYYRKTYQYIESDGAPHRFDAIVAGAAIGLARLYRQHENPEIFELLVNRFHYEIAQSDDVTAACTLQGLPYTGDRRVTPLLIQASASSSAWLRYCALKALGILADPDGLPTLYCAVREGDPLSIVSAAADALALFRQPEADQPLLDGWHRIETGSWSKDHLWCDSRVSIVRALGIIATPRALRFLEQLWRSHQVPLTTLGAIGLAYSGDQQVFQTLISNLSTGDWWTQAGAAAALGRLGNPDAIPALVARLPGTETAGTNVKDAIHAALEQLRQV
ncbi:MAG: HEAT repeat domain-containing protein [Anaerolineae bacterium]